MSENTSISNTIKLHPSWLNYLASEFEADYMRELRQFLVDEKKAGKIIYPQGDFIFNALNTTPFDQVKIVIIGQDPYHGPGQAHGLSFSVPAGVRHPPSLQNIFKEMQSDLTKPPPESGDLTRWAQQGVLLLNAVLTVEHKNAGSHAGRGWERFTDAVIGLLNEKSDHIVFMLWGSYAQKKGALIDTKRHCVLKAVHPSPLSAHRGFFGCQHFSKANHYLESNGKASIEW